MIRHNQCHRINGKKFAYVYPIDSNYSSYNKWIQLTACIKEICEKVNVVYAFSKVLKKFLKIVKMFCYCFEL